MQHAQGTKSGGKREEAQRWEDNKSCRIDIYAG